jgi:hypothetical protein
LILISPVLLTSALDARIDLMTSMRTADPPITFNYRPPLEGALTPCK